MNVPIRYAVLCIWILSFSRMSVMFNHIVSCTCTFIFLLSKTIPVYELLLLSYSVVSDSLQPLGLQHARLPYHSQSPGVCSNSCPLSVMVSNHVILCHLLFFFSLSQHQDLFQWVSSSHYVCILCLILNQDMSFFWSLLLGTTNEDKKELNFPFPSCLQNSTEDVLDDSSCEATIILFSPVSSAHNIKCKKMRNGLCPSI